MNNQYFQPRRYLWKISLHTTQRVCICECVTERYLSPLLSHTLPHSFLRLCVCVCLRVCICLFARVRISRVESLSIGARARVECTANTRTINPLKYTIPLTFRLFISNLVSFCGFRFLVYLESDKFCGISNQNMLQAIWDLSKNLSSDKSTAL